MKILDFIDIDFIALNTRHASGALSAILVFGSLPFETIGVTLAFDSTESKQLFTPFQIIRLAETPFSLKKYYSGAPLKTSDHIQVIEDSEEPPA